MVNYSQCGRIPTATFNCYFAAKLNESTRLFNVGDGRMYNGFFNQVLEEGAKYIVTLAMKILFQVTQIRAMYIYCFTNHLGL
jgi:hypothetical protein